MTPLLPLPIVLHDGERVGVRGRPTRRSVRLPLTLTLSPRRAGRGKASTICAATGGGAAASRARGRRRCSQHELPRVALSLSDPPPARLGELFAPPVEEVWLEIGFGGAEHLLWQARANPHVGLIGCEPFEDGVVKALSAIEREKLANIRLHADDARPLLRWLPDASIARAFILFPDPWPKKRHHKRRLVSAATLAELARVMRPGAELRIATDIGEYARWILLAVRQQRQLPLDRAGPARLARAGRRLASHAL